MSAPSRKIRAFTMPKWGIEMEEGVVREWRAKVGDAVREGELIAVIETDKIANDVELEYAAVLRRLWAKEGETYRVGQLLAVFADADVAEQEIEAFVAAYKEADAGFGNATNAPAVAPLTATRAEPAPLPEGVSISPKALELVRTLNVDLSSVTGAGPGGRITLQDVEQAAKAQGLFGGARKAGNPFETVKLSAMRKTIAKRMSEAARDIPHIFLRSEVDIGALNELRAAQGDAAPSMTAYLVRACAVALRAAPDVNIHFVGDEIRRFRHADIAVAISVPGGLVAPVLRHTDEKTAAVLAGELRDLVERARGEKLTQDDLRDGTFSLSNLGMYGVKNFDAIINPPMGAILSVGASRRVAAEAAKGFVSMVEVTLSCDHRAIDGALGADFLKAFKQAVEAPAQL